MKGQMRSQNIRSIKKETTSPRHKKGSVSNGQMIDLVGSHTTTGWVGSHIATVCKRMRKCKWQRHVNVNLLPTGATLLSASFCLMSSLWRRQYERYEIFPPGPILAGQ